DARFRPCLASTRPRQCDSGGGRSPVVTGSLTARWGADTLATKQWGRDEMTGFRRRAFLGAAAATGAAALLPARRARAQSPVPRLGVLSDMTGPYAEA